MPTLDDETRRRVGEYVESRRVAQGLTLAEASKRAGLSDTKWYQVEKGTTNHRPVTLRKVAEGLGEPPQRIFELAGLPAPQVIVEGPADELALSALSGELHRMSRDELSRLREEIDELLGEGE